MLWFDESARMATCPRCKGHLTENHRCPRSRGRIAFETGLAALGGGLFALLVFSLVDPRGQWGLDGVLLIAGALIGVALDRFFRS
jgi:hypothetical protein